MTLKAALAFWYGPITDYLGAEYELITVNYFLYQLNTIGIINGIANKHIIFNAKKNKIGIWNKITWNALIQIWYIVKKKKKLQDIWY